MINSANPLFSSHLICCVMISSVRRAALWTQGGNREIAVCKIRFCVCPELCTSAGNGAEPLGRCDRSWTLQIQLHFFTWNKHFWGAIRPVCEPRDESHRRPSQTSGEPESAVGIKKCRKINLSCYVKYTVQSKAKINTISSCAHRERRCILQL